MASIEELREVRLNKLQLLQEAGMDPYPASITPDYNLKEVLDNFEEGKTGSIAGRVTAIRGGGAILFVALFDGTEHFQAVLKKDEIDPKIMELFVDTVDVGDFIWFSGKLFTTERGAQSLLVKEWKMAGKSLLPLPDKHAGLQDEDTVLRKRYLDALTNPETFNRFKLRSEIISGIRKFFNERNFMEVETPILQNQAGGAMAETFKTHHNDLDMDMVLRISLELEHKIMMAAGYPRIYEIGKNFRNEGSDPTHIQEFTMMEWYAAFETLEQNMAWTEELLKHLARDIVGKTQFTITHGDETQTIIDLDTSWERVEFSELLLKYASIDMKSISDDELKNHAHKWGMNSEESKRMGRGNLLDFIYKKTARPQIIQPTFVTHYPGEVKPLAQQNEDGTAQVAQLVIDGAELTNQYAELVNPLVQRKLMEAQAVAKKQGDAEAMEIDERFLTAMEHGMPPMTGFGMGIDRLVALFTEQSNLRDVIFFPIMREKEE